MYCIFYFRHSTVRLFLFILLFSHIPYLYAQKELVDYVNTLQGTLSTFDLSRGNTYPCIAMPWGMNVWSPQTGNNGDGWMYTYDAEYIIGFRQTHQCSPWTNDYGTFSLMPVTGKLLIDESKRKKKFSHCNEIATPSAYRVQFDDSLCLKMAPTERGAWFQIIYPKLQEKYLVIDNYLKGGMIKIFPDKNKIIGYTKFSNHSTAHLPEFANYFVITFDQPIKSWGTWQKEQEITVCDSTFIQGKHVGAYLQFSHEKVNLRVASSFISLEQAELNLEKELLHKTCIEEVVTQARSAWNQQLGKIEIEGGKEKDLATFYSCLFRSMLFPRQFFEYNREGTPIYYSPFDGKIHEGYMYTDTGFWDVFRSQMPLNILLHPQLHQKFIDCIIEIYRQSNWLPSWTFPGHSGGMIGNHAFSILTDAYVKGLKVDEETALKAMYHDANAKGPFGPSSGRCAAKEYWSLGYVPHDRNHADTREATAKTLEYSYDDFCAMVFAQKAHNKDLDRFFSKGIYNYRHVFNPETGFMQGKLRNGHWDPTFKAIKWGDPFTEANAWQYTWSVLHDIQGLIELMGGKERFVQKLDSLFHPSNNAIDVGSYSVMIHEMNEMLLVDMGQYAHGNQPVQHIPYLYNYVGMPWKTQYLVRKIMDKLYSSSIDGFCGDEDEGQMSAWYVISALGIYAVCPGTDEYVLGSPLFPKVTIHLENGKKFVIKAKGNDMHRPYIKHARFNGKPYTKNYICYKDIMLGGELELVMSEIPNTLRGIYVEDLPFSLSKENYSK